MAGRFEILIVDDDPENRMFLAAVVDSEGWGYRTAADGNEAIEALHFRKPDLVLLDIMMPGKNGLRVYNEMKRDEELRHVPIIFVTGSSEATGVNVRTGEERKLSDYADQWDRAIGSRIHRRLERIEPDGLIEKPVEPPLLVGTIKQVLAA